MATERDPVAREAGDSVDLYDVSTWEVRSSIDGLAVAIYSLLVGATRVAVVGAALVILVAIGGLTVFDQPGIGILTALSAIPAFGLAGYVYLSDATENEPLSLLVVTFLLSVLTASFAAIINTVLNPAFQAIPLVGGVLFFFFVVGPVEETVKLLAVRLHAFRSAKFDAVIDGAVYGAVAGLGFAFIENSLYIAQQLDATAIDPGLQLFAAGSGITATRALAGPGHVIYSAYAGYYLGLAKFNRENAGPIVIKGLLIAAFIHATYNTFAGPASGLIFAFTPLNQLGAFLVFVLVYDGLFGGLLLRKVRRYSRAYRIAHDANERAEGELSPDATEFE
jgi:RsiW-degrading membrane proteinase PrsW (M82 family)